MEKIATVQVRFLRGRRIVRILAATSGCKRARPRHGAPRATGASQSTRVPDGVGKLSLGPVRRAVGHNPPKSLSQEPFFRFGPVRMGPRQFVDRGAACSSQTPRRLCRGKARVFRRPNRP